MAVTDLASGTWTDISGSTFTVTIASPGVFTLNSHGMVAGDKVVFQTTGALPTGLTAGTTYYVISGGLSSNAFEVSTSDGGSAVNTSGSQSGTHSITNVEHILANTSAAASYQMAVNLTNMASGVITELRTYNMLVTGGTRAVQDFWQYRDAQATDDMVATSIVRSTALTDSGALRFTIKQTAGTAKSYVYEILKFA